MQSSTNYSLEMRGMVNNISFEKEQTYNLIKNLKGSSYNKKYDFAYTMIRSKDSNFKAIDWIYLRENLCKDSDRGKTASKIDQIVKGNSQNENECRMYFTIASLCDMGSDKREREIEVLIKPFQEIQIEEDVIVLAEKLALGDIYWGTHARVVPVGMNDWEVAALLRALSAIKKENRQDIIEKTKPYIEDYYMDQRCFKKDMKGHMVAGLLQAIDHSCVDSDIRDAIEKTKSLTDESWAGHDKDFLKGMLSIPLQERNSLVQELKNHRESFALCFPYHLNPLVFFYLLPNYLRTEGKIWGAFKTGDILESEFQEAFVISLKSKMTLGFSSIAEIQLSEFITALKLPEEHPLMQLKLQLKGCVKVVKPTEKVQKAQRENCTIQ